MTMRRFADLKVSLELVEPLVRVVLRDRHGNIIARLPTRPPHHGGSMLAAVEEALRRAGIMGVGPADLARLAHICGERQA